MGSGRPQHIKLVNDALVREALLALGEATSADLSAQTGLSQTSVGAIVEEMRGSGMLLEAVKRASSGGRRATAWVLDPRAWSTLSLAMERDRLDWSIADARGRLVRQGTAPVAGAQLEEALALAAELAPAAAAESSAGARRCALAVGLPGAVLGGRLITGDFLEAWRDLDLGALFAERSGLPAIAENDLNAIALGYAYAGQVDPTGSLVYVHFNGGACIGSGLVIGGKIYRGAASYAGELGFMPVGGGRVLDDAMLAAERDEDYVAAVATALRVVNCVVNPALIAVGGRRFRQDLGGAIAASFGAAVEARIRPRLVFVEDSRPFYMGGLARLAAELIFPGFRLERRGYSE
jgi:hypothetical protein